MLPLHYKVLHNKNRKLTHLSIRIRKLRHFHVYDLRTFTSISITYSLIQVLNSILNMKVFHAYISMRHSYLVSNYIKFTFLKHSHYVFHNYKFSRFDCKDLSFHMFSMIFHILEKALIFFLESSGDLRSPVQNKREIIVKFWYKSSLAKLRMCSFLCVKFGDEHLYCGSMVLSLHFSKHNYTSWKVLSKLWKK